MVAKYDKVHLLTLRWGMGKHIRNLPKLLAGNAAVLATTPCGEKLV